MFTGIIEELGTVLSVEGTDDSAIITIDAKGLVADLELGGSLAVNGICLTSVRQEAEATINLFTAEVMGETLRLTGLGALRAGDRVNLERCVSASARLDGHIVQGHVDGCGGLRSRIDRADWSTLRIGIPKELAPYTAVKGSIALNGVSLTLTAVSEPDAEDPWVEVGLIPATLSNTTFGEMNRGARVNVEVDVLAKYTARLLAFRDAASPTSSTTRTTVNEGVDND